MEAEAEVEAAVGAAEDEAAVEEVAEVDETVIGPALTLDGRSVINAVLQALVAGEEVAAVVVVITEEAEAEVGVVVMVGTAVAGVGITEVVVLKGEAEEVLTVGTIVEPPMAPPSSYGGGRPNSLPPTYGVPPPYGGDGGPPRGGPARGGPPGGYDGGYGGPPRGGGGYGGGPPVAESPVKVKQCDENCDEMCDNSRIYISNLPPDVTTTELQELFGGIGQVGRIKQKRGYKDQWPYNIKIYTDDSGNSKGDACLSYEDPSAAHSAGDYDLRGYKISVAMAEKSAPRPQPAHGHGGGRGGYGGGGGGRRDNYRDSGGGADRHHHGGQRSRPY
ncbi:hypothetical protein QJS10_CPA03g01102 [Acorus calamus]|uniref:RRM domain-containing protein n=1 Tax=Acorus calamus TaxID=4465 RepID=A0AAV9F9C4_ACOCL|nr:hypothetical protein QJS10_CPA03g01102 [Acorus calamus]